MANWHGLAQANKHLQAVRPASGAFDLCWNKYIAQFKIWGKGQGFSLLDNIIQWDKGKLYIDLEKKEKTVIPEGQCVSFGTQI